MLEDTRPVWVSYPFGYSPSATSKIFSATSPCASRWTVAAASALGVRSFDRTHGAFRRSEKSAIDAVKPCRKFLLPTGPSSPAQKKPATGGSSSSEASRAAS
jgi:hypothetical protein